MEKDVSFTCAHEAIPVGMRAVKFKKHAANVVFTAVKKNTHARISRA